MTAKRSIRHQHYHLRLGTTPAYPSTYVVGLARGIRNEIIPHKTTSKAQAWRTCNHPIALALKGQLLVLCGVEATIEVCHYPGKKRMRLPPVPPLLSQGVLDKMNFSARQGSVAAAQYSFNYTQAQALAQMNIAKQQLMLQQLSSMKQGFQGNKPVQTIVDELINPPPGVIP